MAAAAAVRLPSGAYCLARRTSLPAALPAYFPSRGSGAAHHAYLREEGVTDMVLVDRLVEPDFAARVAIPSPFATATLPGAML